MLVGYVSDERYLALPDVLMEFINESGSVEARSQVSGAVHADLAPGPYRVLQAKAGYGAKVVHMEVKEDQPYHFRLLSDTLYGYAWPKWVKAGERSEFRVHSSEAYKLELWRYGWKKEFVRLLGWYDEHGPRANIQVTPDGDYTQTGVRWNLQGFTHAHRSLSAEAPARSGLYYFHVKGESGAFFSFPWVVAPERRQAPVVVLASDINWNAYNNFGGRSNYIHPEGLPPTPTVNARQELTRYTDPDFSAYDAANYPPLSFDRPEIINHVPEAEEVTNPIEGRAANHVAPAEWRLLGWLEREGFSYDLYAESQLHHGHLDLDAYQVLVLGPHPEYWSVQMYERLKSWVHERGGKLLYLGGNGINGPVEFASDYSVTHHNGNDAEMREGKYESRFHRYHEPEATLLGIGYTTAGIMTAAPYRVIDGEHWALAGTGLRAGDLIGQQSLHMRVPGGASGHETDKILPSSPTNVQLIAKGTNPDGGGAEMAYYDLPRGGAVFGTGSICYVSSLLVDDALSRITGNVLHRFLGES